MFIAQIYNGRYGPLASYGSSGLFFEQTGATQMSFAMHINMERCTGCNNCVVACPVNALELHTVDPATTDKIYKVFDGKATCLDVNHELCAGCGVCVEVCPYEVVSLVAPKAQKEH